MVTKSSSNIPTATSGTVLQGQGIAVDSAFSTATYPATTVANEVLYSSATNVVSGIATVANRILSTDASGVPSWGTELVAGPTFSTTTAGITRTLTVINTDNTNTSSNSVILAETAGSSAGNPKYTSTTTTSDWAFGIHNSITSPTADPFVLSQGTTLGTNNVMSVATSGEINYPLQPAFLGTLGTQVNNVTGDGTTFQLGTTTALTEVFDQNADFNTNGTFTAPVTGRYHFEANFSVSGSSAVGQLYCYVEASNRTLCGTYNRTDATNTHRGVTTCLIDMDAADTATTRGFQNGGTLTADVTTASFFCGYLAC